KGERGKRGKGEEEKAMPLPLPLFPFVHFLFFPSLLSGFALPHTLYLIHSYPHASPAGCLSMVPLDGDGPEFVLLVRIGLMNTQPNTRRSWHVVIICLLALWSMAAAQGPQNRSKESAAPQNPNSQNQVPANPRPSPPGDVVKVYTELVQTDVMVFDKRGRFVTGLTPNDFQLRIDGQLRPVQSFDLIKAGSNEEEPLAAARGGRQEPAEPINSRYPNRPVPLDRGRTVIFFVDDL